MTDSEEVVEAVAVVASVAIAGGLVAAAYLAVGPFAPFVIAHPAISKGIHTATGKGIKQIWQSLH